MQIRFSVAKTRGLVNIVNLKDIFELEIHSFNFNVEKNVHFEGCRFIPLKGKG